MSFSRIVAAVLTSPEGLLATLLIEGKIRLDLTEDRAGFLQKIAYETVKNLEIGNI